MTDVIFVAVVIAFFAIATVYVKGCARIVGDDDVVRADTPDAASDGEREEASAA